MPKKKILFVCTHNSARSQLAEGLVNHDFSDNWQAFSAGTEVTKVKKLAIEVMADIGIDITAHYSKSIDQFLNMELDYVVTVCDSAKEQCPYFPGAGSKQHHSFADPSDIVGTKEERYEAFTKTRDEIKAWLDITLPNWE